MAFNSSTNTNKNQFVARMVSRSSGKSACWINLTETLCRTVFATDLPNITATQALEKLPPLFNNDLLEVVITDLTKETATITDIKDF